MTTAQSDLETARPWFVPAVIWRSWSGFAPNVKGAIWVLAAALLFSVMAAMVKFLGKGLNAPQIAFFRGLIGLFFISPFLIRMGPRGILTRRPLLHVLRGVLGASGIMLGFYALIHMPLADASAISFARVLFLVPMAFFILKEQVGVRRIVAAIVGFVGVLVFLRPTGSVEPAALVAVTSALLVSGAIVSIKILSRTDDPVTLQFYSGIFSVLFTAIPAALTWTVPTLDQWFWLILMGATGTAAQLCFLRGYHVGDATALAPYDYTRLLFAALIGFMFFSEIPELATYAGAALIAGSTLYITYREQQARRASATTTNDKPASSPDG